MLGFIYSARRHGIKTAIGSVILVLGVIWVIQVTGSNPLVGIAIVGAVVAFFGYAVIAGGRIQKAKGAVLDVVSDSSRPMDERIAAWNSVPNLDVFDLWRDPMLSPEYSEALREMFAYRWTHGDRDMDAMRDAIRRAYPGALHASLARVSKRKRAEAIRDFRKAWGLPTDQAAHE